MQQSGVGSMQGSNEDCLPLKGHTRGGDAPTVLPIEWTHRGGDAPTMPNERLTHEMKQTHKGIY